MVACICGLSILEEVGDDGSVLTSEQEKKWMRRRTDVLACPACGRRYDLADLKYLANAPSVRH